MNESHFSFEVILGANIAVVEAALFILVNDSDACHRYDSRRLAWPLGYMAMPGTWY